MVRRISALVVTSLIVSTGSLHVSLADSLTATELSQSRPTNDPRDAELAESLDGIASVLRNWLASSPPDPRDRLAIIARVGSDPEALRQWVRDNTHLVPYRGVLRNTDGVLLDRAGNSLDRSLLLTSLLRDAGLESRIAHGQLTQDQATRLAATLTNTATKEDGARPAVGQREISELRDVLLADDRVDTQLVDNSIKALVARRSALDDGVRERFSLIGPSIGAAVNPYLAGARAQFTERVRGILQDHWWAEYRSERGFVRLDPSVEIVGDVSPEEYVAPQAVPAELMHSVVFRVVLELSSDKVRREVVLLDRELRPWELYDRPIYFAHVTPGASSTPQEPAALLQNIVDRRLWIPTLMVGDEGVADKGFTRSGAIVNAKSSIAGAEVAAGRLAKMFEDPNQAPSAPQEPSAEWLEFEVRVPGERPTLYRRQVFDVVGPAARSTGSFPIINAAAVRARATVLAGQVDVMISAATLPEDAINLWLAPDFLRLTEIMASAVREQRAPADLDLQSIRRVPLTSYAFRERRLRTGLTQYHVAVASPNVDLIHSEIVELAGSTPAIKRSFDIVANDGFADPSSLLRQGILDTILESELLDPRSLENTATLYARDLAAGHAWSIITDPASPALARLGADADQIARLRFDLNSGFIVLLPAQRGSTSSPATLSWWRINPRTGSTLGIGTLGRGTTGTDLASLFRNLTIMVACSVAGLGTAIAGDALGTIAAVACAAGAFGAGIGVSAGFEGGAAFGERMGVVGAVAALLDGTTKGAHKITGR